MQDYLEKLRVASEGLETAESMLSLWERVEGWRHTAETQDERDFWGCVHENGVRQARQLGITPRELAVLMFSHVERSRSPFSSSLH